MLNSFQDRERAAEFLFVRAEEARFTTHLRGIRALALFAMDQLGVDAPTSETYAEVLIAASVEGLSGSALIERVRADLGANGVDVDASVLQSVLLQASAEARSIPTVMAGAASRLPALRTSL